MRQTLKTGFLVLVVAALVTSGIALAQTADENAEGDTPATRIMERLAPLVEDGTITEGQAQAVSDTLAEGFGIRGDGHKPGSPRGHRGAGGEAVAEFLGITTDDLKAAHDEGLTLAEIAATNGSSRAALVEFLVGEAETRLDEAVAEGKIDEAEKAEKLSEITEKIGQMVDGELERPEGRRGPGERRGPGGPRNGEAPENAGANI